MYHSCEHDNDSIPPASVPQWYMSPDYNLFSPYVEHRKRFPAQPFYILHPRFIWQLWDVIQGNTLENIQPNPPSSGFIGETSTHSFTRCLPVCVCNHVIIREEETVKACEG